MFFIRQLRNNPKYEFDDQHLFTIAKDYYYPSNFIKFYGGHQYKIGHYFRHLFLTFTFINEQNFLSRKEKYFYAKLLRAQLSTSEQGLLFINSLSTLGLVWDINPKVKKTNILWLDKILIKPKRLITKYNLIKNLPGKEVFGIRAFAFKLVILILCKRHYQKLSVVFDFSISDTFSLGLAS